MQAASLKPLSGVRVIVTRQIGQAEYFSKKLRELGAVPIELPTIKTVPTKSIEALDRALARLSEYDWIVFTSVQGVNFLTKRLADLKIPSTALKQVMLAAIGPATASALEQTIKKPEFVPSDYLSWKIVDGLGDLKGKRVLLPRADIASKKLPDALRERGALVEEVVAYRTIIPPGLTPDRLQPIFRGADLITFTSPSTIRNLAEALGVEFLKQSTSGLKVACIGPVTVEAAKELGVHVDIVAEVHSVDGLVEAIVHEIRAV
jgi:uroporphyrinogen-III synthase